MPFKDLAHDLNSSEDCLLQEVIHRVDDVELNVYIYNESSYFEKKCSNVSDILSTLENIDNTKCAWIEVIGSIDELNDVVRQLGIHFNLHLLAPITALTATVTIYVLTLRFDLLTVELLTVFQEISQ